MDFPEIECTECGWQGFVFELLCSEEDLDPCIKIEDVKFNICPDCGAVDSTEDYEE